MSMEHQIEVPTQAADTSEPDPPTFKQAIAAGVSVGLIVVIVVIFLARGSSPASGGGNLVPGKPYEIPKYYGKILDERNIWIYQGDEEPSAFESLCTETINEHKGDFTVRTIKKGDVWDYVSPAEMPADWGSLSPKYQRDSTMNALLARYGGVALDTKTIMFRSFNTWWANMLEQDNTFKGYRYKMRNEVATWFMMSRREGLMRTAATEQASGSAGCPEKDTEYGLCYGSTIMSRALCRYQSQYCQCFMSGTAKQGCTLQQWRNLEDIEGGLDVSDPRKSPMVQPPLASLKAGQDVLKKPEEWPVLGTPLDEQKASFTTDVYNRETPFLTLQIPGGAEKMSREELLANKETWFYYWLCKADRLGNLKTDASVCGGADA